MKPNRKSLRTRSGQSIVEFALSGVLVIIVLMGVFEIGRYISLQLRMSSAAREGGRLMFAENLMPKDGAPVNWSNISSNVNTKVYSQIKSSVSPSDLDQDEGRVFISILKRTDDGSSNVPSQTEITVEKVFSYGTWSSPDPAPSPMYSENHVIHGDDANRLIDPISLRVGERTVLVEISHPLSFTNFLRSFLTMSGWSRIYEYSVF